MRRFLLLLTIAFPLSCLAQIGEPRSQLSLGGGAGVALSKVSFSPSVVQSYHTAPYGGLTVRYTCEKYFSLICALQAEFNYGVMGWTEHCMSSANVPLPDTYSRHIHYLQVPLLAHLGLGREQQGFMGYLLLGPQVGFALGDNESRSSVWTLDEAGHPDRLNGRYAQYDLPLKHKFDYGITGGLGVQYSTGTGHFLLEGRYYFGLSDLFGAAKGDAFSRSSMSAIYIRAAYLFDI